MILSDSEDTLGSATLLFGSPKVGKTELAGTMAEFYNITWFDLENGSKTLRTRLPKELQKRINLVKIPDTKTNPCGINTLLKVFTGTAVEICTAHGLTNCASCRAAKASSTKICLNDLTRENDLVVVDGLGQLTDSAYNLISGGDPNYKMEWDDWLKENQLLSMVLSQLQQAKYNSICISHEIEVEMEDGSKQLVPLCGTKPFSSRVAKFFSNVVYMRYKMKKFEAGATQDFAINVVAGNRSGLKLGGGIRLIDLVRNPDTEMSMEEYRSGQSAGPEKAVEKKLPSQENKQLAGNSGGGSLKDRMAAIKQIAPEVISTKEISELAINAQPESVTPITTTAAENVKPQVVRSMKEILAEKAALKNNVVPQ